ncbi:MAG: hypothetical protein AAB373_06805 [Patescibacteria group bacterium]
MFSTKIEESLQAYKELCQKIGQEAILKSKQESPKAALEWEKQALSEVLNNLNSTLNSHLRNHFQELEAKIKTQENQQLSDLESQLSNQ